MIIVCNKTFTFYSREKYNWLRWYVLFPSFHTFVCVFDAKLNVMNVPFFLFWLLKRSDEGERKTKLVRRIKQHDKDNVRFFFCSISSFLVFTFLSSFFFFNFYCLPNCQSTEIYIDMFWKVKKKSIK